MPQCENCEQSLIWGKMRTICRRQALLSTGGTAPKRFGLSTGVTSVKGVLTLKHLLWQRAAASHEEQVSLLLTLVLF